MKAFLACPDFESFRRRFGEIPHLRFAALLFKEKLHPTTEQVLEWDFNTVFK